MSSSDQQQDGQQQAIRPIQVLYCQGKPKNYNLNRDIG